MTATWGHRFTATEHVLVGPGTLASLAGECDALGMHRVVVVTGRSLRENTPVIAEAERLLGERHAATFSGITEHAPASGVRALTDVLREHGADGAVAIGGGSPIDATKAALHALDGGTTRQIAVPTTLSAAEFTPTAGVTDDQTRRKGGVAGYTLAPRAVILDPQTTVHTPERLWLSTGIRALDHAVEAVYAPEGDRLAIELGLRAIAMLRSALPASRDDAQDVAPRGEAQVAAWYSGMALAAVSVVPSHPLGRILGATFDIGHGITSCVLLPAAIDWTAQREPARVEPLCAAFEVQRPEDVGTACRAFVASLGLPTTLRDVGLDGAALQRYLEMVPEQWRDIPRAAY
ncbi:MAG TPA: iron-containing alcohol dehydrogenase [Candidatus Dormibacteraeota bacterium]|jgi:alcohol dehydrogenase class IV|nr:iron-containing alcohol dehydrogenase [Candidatus Dormibacteraeota bacterium]